MPLYVCRKGCFCRVFFEYMHETTPMSDDTHPTDETATPHQPSHPNSAQPPNRDAGEAVQTPVPAGRSGEVRESLYEGG